MSERVVESSVDEVPEIPEILEKVLLFSLDRAKTKMEAGEDIIPFTSLAVKVGTMQSDTASTLVAAGAITVFLMPLLGSITYQVADVHPVTAVREIAHTPSDWQTIVREHAQVRALLHHQDRLKRMAETLESLEKQEGLNGLDSRRAELVERARLEIDRQLKELGLDPQLTTQLPHNYRYPKN